MYLRTRDFGDLQRTANLHVNISRWLLGYLGFVVAKEVLRREAVTRIIEFINWHSNFLTINWHYVHVKAEPMSSQWESRIKQIGSESESPIRTLKI